MAETFLFDSVDIQSITGVHIAEWDGQFGLPDLRGDDLTIPQVDGVEELTRPFGTSVFTIPLELVTDSLAARNDALAALATLIKPGRVMTCTRRRTFGSGDVDHTARVRYLSGFDPSWIETDAARLALSFTNLNGLWYGASVAPTIPATITVTGVAPTRRITLGLPAAGTLTNTTLGVSVTVTTGPVTLDVKARTSTGSVLDVATAGDPLSAWFVLAPGSNVITWSGSGTPTLAYLPAF